ncbi:MAG: IS66 family transposase [Coprococcus phoceensis]
MVHDHDLTFYHYGANHQECLAHVLRYLKDSIDNEPERTWNKEMRSLVQEMIHFRKGFQPTQEPDLKKVSEFEKDIRRYWKPPERNTGTFRQMIIIETGIIYF